MNLYYDQTSLALFMKSAINFPISDDTRYIGCVREDLSIAGCVAYNCWLEDSVFMHVAFSPHAVSREMLREAFSYPFEICQKKRVYGLTPITSQRALRFSERLGFKEISRTLDFRLSAISREECRWINDATNKRGSDSWSYGLSTLQPH